MKQNKTHLVTLFSVLILLSSGCGPAFLKKIIKDHPEIITESIKSNPVIYLEALTEAQRAFMQEKRKQQAKDELTRQEGEYKNPKKPDMPDTRVYFGDKKAPITIVEYSDFQCGYCARSVGTVKQVLNTYSGKVRVLYKHFPVTGSPNSVPAAKYYEAIGRQDVKKARKFHDMIFAKQGEVRSGGEKTLKKIAEQLKVDSIQLEKDLKQVGDIIESDRKEAIKFGFSGTPGFLVGGITVPGALPYSKFKTIIDRHLKGPEPAAEQKKPANKDEKK